MSLQLAPWAIPVAKVTADEKAEISRLLAQGDRNAAKIERAFVAAVERLGDGVDGKEIVRLLRAGQIEAAIGVVEAAALAAGFEGVSGTITAALIDSGRSIAARITVPGAVEFQFGITNPSTVTYLQQNEFSLIRELTDHARASVATSIREGVKDGRNPLDVARDVRQSIGLTERQTRAVINYRRLLEARHLDALERKLRDKRFDGTVRQAIKDQKPIPKAKIDKMVERYRARYLKYRSETIGRTEGLRAANAGAHLAWVQAVNSGKVRLDQIVRKWITSEDHLVRDAHRAIPKLNPDGVGLMEPFKSPLGPILMPGDPNADPANTINCFTGDVRPVFTSPLRRLMRRWYSGPLLTIRLEGGAELSVTPNHPIFSGRGEVAAGALNEGDDVLYGLSVKTTDARAHPDRGPATFAEIFELALIRFDAVGVSGRRPDFHGDGFEADVDIVSTEGLLGDWAQTACGQGQQHLMFTGAHMGAVALARNGSSGDLCVRASASAHRSMGSIGQRGALLGAGSRHAAKHAFASVRRGYASLLERAADLGSLVAQGRRYSLYAFAGVEPLEGFGNRKFRLERPFPTEARNDPDALTVEAQRPVSLRPTKEGNDGFNAGGLTIGFRRVVEIVRQDVWSGHVYNSETEGGAYLANGVASRNCRCTTFIRYRMRPTAPKEPEPAPEPPKPTLAERNATAGKEAEEIIREAGKQTGMEHLRWVDLAKGELSADANSGTKGQVNFTPAFAAAIADPKRKIEAHHNHPRSTSLSRPDIMETERNPGLHRLYAHGHDGSRYMIEDVKPGAEARFMSMFATVGQDKEAAAALKRISPDTLTEISNHIGMLAVARAGLATYRADLSPRRKRWDSLYAKEIETILEGMDRMAARVKKAARAESAPGFIDPPYGAPVEDWQEHLDGLLLAAKTTKGLEPAIEEARRAVKAGGLTLWDAEAAAE